MSKAKRVLDPPSNCRRCPRLVAYRKDCTAAEPGWFNRPVPSFGSRRSAKLLIVGLAPGLRGANRTGRSFTGDQSGELLYSTLLSAGFAQGQYRAVASDSLALVDTLVTNAVRCVPPGNKPTAGELKNCRDFLLAVIQELKQLRIIVALGRVAHDSTLSAFGLRQAAYKFGHGARHELGGGIVLFDSYHCSRYNTNTGRLTPEMFLSVFERVRAELDCVGSKKAAEISDNLPDKIAKHEQHKGPQEGR